MGRERDGIWIIDADGKTSYANDRMAEILSTRAEDIIGQPSFEYVFAEDVGHAQKLFAAKMNGDAHPFTFRLRRKDNVGIWVRVQGTPMTNASGTFLGIVGTFTVQPKAS